MKTEKKNHVRPEEASSGPLKNKSVTVQLSKDAYDLLMHEKTSSGGTFSEIIDGLVKGEKIPDIDVREDASLISKMEKVLANSKKYKNVKKRRDALHRKVRIMKTALKLFAEEGYHAVTVEDIIHHVDMTRGTFYKHFKSKENIIQLILDTYKHYLEDILVELIDSCQGENSNRWKDIILNKAGELLAMPQITYFLKVIFGELSQIKASFSDDIASYENQMTDTFAQAIQVGQELGDFSKEFDSQIAALCIIGGLKQVFSSQRAKGNAEDALNALDSTYDFFVKGIYVR